ncbi:polyunsaturated fatty acid 5-lipoxygenase-like [Scyliorhinus canicula]|uniref:polyunsaturated fatty acid 5-lipoxygenase-like n=1 Tax=Scyliorhinus canicula TaxID=7830 RepID=UPI0018F41EAE|nr:polyunsaturated fatty acid 5-lipoxygenase-like [Scyliorhinus canicula]
MATYRATFRTGTQEHAGTKNNVHCTLIGLGGLSRRITVNRKLRMDLKRGAVDQYPITSAQDLDTMHFLELEVYRRPLAKYLSQAQDYWFCSSVTVETPSGENIHFPCHRWLDNCTIRLREGSAKLRCDDQLEVFLTHRQDELLERQQRYRWMTWAPNMPQCIDADSVSDLPVDMRFSAKKERYFKQSSTKAAVDLVLGNFMSMVGKSWTTVEDFDHIFTNVKSPIAVFVREQWKEDWFFGYQFLNSLDPTLIRKCDKMPANFPVTDAMVGDSLGHSTLEEEIKKGNIFIVSYEMLDGLPANVIDGVQQYLAAPICLLHQNEQHQLMPIAIQLNQTPGDDNPIFLPSDTEMDWLLAKIWVRSSYVQYFEVITHLLKTHLMAETFSVATLRQLPSVHPIYKLLVPHVRYTMQINTEARNGLIDQDGIIAKTFGVGAKGLLLLCRKEFLAMTYQSFCLPEHLEHQGVKDLKDYYYRDDSMLIWSAIHRFVTNIVTFYYKDDHQVANDPELQAWIQELTDVGLHNVKNSGFPTSLNTRMELCKFATMMIFTCSAQHAAVNNGQFDWTAWVPNAPASMRKPPPTSKGTVTMEHIMESLPDIPHSCIQMAITWTLSRPQPAMRKLGDYEGHFTDGAAKEHIREFQEELKKIDRKIQDRNARLSLKYEYLHPENIENSITI